MRADSEMLESADELPFSKDEHVVLVLRERQFMFARCANATEKGYNAEALEGGYAAWRSPAFQRSHESSIGVALRAVHAA